MTNQKTFMREWREFRGLSIEDVADLIKTSKGYLSDLERGVRRYNQTKLEQIARALNCAPGDLLSYDPNMLEPIAHLWARLSPEDRERFHRMMQALAPE